MDVVNGRRESDDPPRVAGYGQMVTRVSQELRRQARSHGMVEDIRRHVGEQSLVSGAEKTYFESHFLSIPPRPGRQSTAAGSSTERQ